MTTAQFYFSSLTGLSLVAGGTTLASLGVADWGLFWIGTSITALALVFRFRDAENEAIEPQRVAATASAPWPGKQ